MVNPKDSKKKKEKKKVNSKKNFKKNKNQKKIIKIINKPPNEKEDKLDKKSHLNIIKESDLPELINKLRFNRFNTRMVSLLHSSNTKEAINLEDIESVVSHHVSDPGDKPFENIYTLNPKTGSVYESSIDLSGEYIQKTNSNLNYTNDPLDSSFLDNNLVVRNSMIEDPLIKDRQKNWNELNQDQIKSINPNRDYNVEVQDNNPPFMKKKRKQGF